MRTALARISAGVGRGPHIIQVLLVALTGILKRRHCEDQITQPNYPIVLANVTIIIETNAILRRRWGVALTI